MMHFVIRNFIEPLDSADVHLHVGVHHPEEIATGGLLHPLVPDLGPGLLTDAPAVTIAAIVVLLHLLRVNNNKNTPQVWEIIVKSMVLFK